MLRCEIGFPDPFNSPDGPNEDDTISKVQVHLATSNKDVGGVDEIVADFEIKPTLSREEEEIDTKSLLSIIGSLSCLNHDAKVTVEGILEQVIMQALKPQIIATVLTREKLEEIVRNYDKLNVVRREVSSL